MASRNLGAPNAYKKDIDAPGKHGGPSYQRRQRKWMAIAPTSSGAAPQFVVEELPDDFCKARTGFIRHPPGLTVRSAWSKELRPKRRQ
jgi:hypothetical protein